MRNLNEDEFLIRCSGDRWCPKFIKNTNKEKYLCMTCEEKSPKKKAVRYLVPDKI